MRSHKGIWCLLPLLGALAAGCDLPGTPREEDRPRPANKVKDFDTLYSARCAGCHGADGKLGPAPPLNDPIFLAIVPDDELLRVIYEGRAVTPPQRSPMPAFGAPRAVPLTDSELRALAEPKEEHHAAVRLQGPLTDAQVAVLAEGIKKRWGPPASGDLPPYLSPTGGKGGNDKTGAGVFNRACANCHGPQGEGVRDGRPTDGGAINNLAFLALISDKALRRSIITGRPDLGMPPYNGKAGRPADFHPLTSADIDDLVALLRSWRAGGPSNTN
jgi:cytochrome c oxidase cbb3-type subunit 3/ubiquinol-cytochrome c reductase cytochrome c subunit